MVKSKGKVVYVDFSNNNNKGSREKLYIRIIKMFKRLFRLDKILSTPKNIKKYKKNIS